MKELMCTIPNKLKFTVCPPSSSIHSGRSGPETLLVAYPWVWTPKFLKMLQEILNKRWQTLDLKSMMSELQRSSPEIMITQDTLSSVHRFKRKEGTSLS